MENIVDVLNSTVYPGTLEIRGGRIARIAKDKKEYETFILPGLVDAHIHIEGFTIHIRQPTITNPLLGK